MFASKACRFFSLILCLLVLTAALPAAWAAAEISLSPNAMELNAGASSAPLQVSTSLSGPINWSSLNPGVASVDQQGVVTGVAPGATLIIATCGGSSAACEVTVLDITQAQADQMDFDTPALTPVTGVELIRPSGATLSGGFQLGARVLPEDATDQTVFWQSSDETVATVDETGYVTYVSPGSATITATTRDGGFTDTLSFTVRSSVVPVESIRLDPGFRVLNIGSTAFLTVDLKPENASNQAVDWDSSDDTVAKVSQRGEVSALASGLARITATTQDGGHTASTDILVPPDNGAVAVQSVALNLSDAQLQAGSTAFLRASLEPEDASVTDLIWYSDYAPVAQMDQNGVVTALSPGTATIYAVAAGGVLDRCTLIVTGESAAQTGPSEDGEPGDQTPSADPESPEDGAVFSRLAQYQGFSDVDESYWYGAEQQGVIQTAVELDIMNGYPDGTFRPQNEISLAEAVKMAAVVHDRYHNNHYSFDMSQGSHWYDTYVTYALEQGIIQPDEFSDFSASAARCEMAYLFYMATEEAYLTVLNEAVTISDVAPAEAPTPTRYASQILALYRAGVLTGDNELTRAFRPEDAISRAEAAAIIARVCLPEKRVSFDAAPQPETQQPPEQEEAAEESARESDYLALYQPVLDMYSRYLQEDPETYALYNDAPDYAEPVYPSILIRTSDALGYALEDLDGNGVPELLIGAMPDLGNDSLPYSSGIIYDVFTLEDGQPRRVVVSWERSRNYLTQDNRILLEGSNGAAYSVMSLYSLNGTSLELEQSLRTTLVDGDLVWYRTTQEGQYFYEGDLVGRQIIFSIQRTIQLRHAQRPVDVRRRREILQRHL